MKVRFGDLTLKTGKTIEEEAQVCLALSSCDKCDYYGKVECCLMPEMHDSRIRIVDIMNYEIEVPEASITAASDDRPQKDDDMDDNEQNWYKKVYICSPYRGYTFSNAEAAQQFCKWAAFEKDVLPVAPHIYFTQFFEDDVPEQRKIGMDMGIQWLNECSEIWVLGETLSDGMAREIAEAGRLGLPIRFFAEGEDGCFVER